MADDGLFVYVRERPDGEWGVGYAYDGEDGDACDDADDVSVHRSRWSAAWAARWMARRSHAPKVNGGHDG